MSEALGWVFNPMDQTPETIIRGAGHRGYQLYADNLAAARRSPEKQREGAYMTVRGAFDEMAAPKVLRGIDHRPSQSFSIGDWLRQGQGTVYLLSHKVDMAGAEKVVSIMVADILREAREQAVASAGGRLDPLLNFSGPTKRSTPANCPPGTACWPTPEGGGSRRRWRSRAARCSAAGTAGNWAMRSGRRPECG